MVTVRPRIRTGRVGRPATTAVAASAAITDARSTEGSNRVSSANHPMRASVAAHRVGARARRSTGEAAARSSATFSPDTTLKWARPESRNASTMVGGWPRSSPMTKPRYRLRSTGSMVRAPRSSSSRTRLAEWASVVPSPTSSSRVGSRTATMWRLRNHPATTPPGGTRRPSTASCSPASRGRRRRAVPPKARSSRWYRPATASATTPAPSGLGSVRSVTTPVNGAGGSGAAPAQARAASVQERAKHPAATSTACPRRIATSTAAAAATATPGHGVGTASHAPAAVARAAATTAPSPSPRAGDAVRPHRTPSIGPWPDRA